MYPRIIKAGTNKLWQCIVSAQVCSEQDAKSRLSGAEGTGIKTSYRQAGHISTVSSELRCSPSPCWFAPDMSVPGHCMGNSIPNDITFESTLFWRRRAIWPRAPHGKWYPWLRVLCCRASLGGGTQPCFSQEGDFICECKHVIQIPNSVTQSIQRNIQEHAYFNSYLVPRGAIDTVSKQVAVNSLMAPLESLD